MNAFLYLVTTSARNRLVHALRRVRSPRYAIAFIIGVLYIWSFLFRPVNHPGATAFLLGQPTEMFVSVLAAVTLMGSWVFGSDVTALAFSQAEVSFLFSAPLSRRGLIGYKLFRAQIAVLVNALIWVFVLRRGGTLLPPVLRAVGLWVMFSTLNLHRLGAALVRSSWSEHGRPGTRRHLRSMLVFGVVGALLLAGIVQSRAELLHTRGMSSFFTALGDVLAKPPGSWGLFPFHLVVAPSFARTSAGWLRAMGPAVVLMFAHVWWVLHTDAAFEDAAIDASAERAKRLLARGRRGLTPLVIAKPTRTTIALAPVGHPALAIFWKNLVCLRRTLQLRLFVGPFVMAVAIGAAAAEGRGDWTEIFAVCATAFAATLLLFGGRLIRNDLRQDMQHLPLLKTLPIEPGDIVLAEVASSALPVSVVQFAFLALAYLVLLLSPFDPLGGRVRLALLVASPFVVLALNGALLTIQNGTAVMFPAWIRLGPTVSTGVEALGQNVLGTVANLVSLALALVPPAIVAWIVLATLGWWRPLALIVAGIGGALLLAAETYGAMRVLGRVLARAEPLQTT